MRTLGFTFIADTAPAERAKKQLQREMPDARFEIMPGYENTEPKRYRVILSAEESITKAVANVDAARQIVYKAIREVKENGEI